MKKCTKCKKSKQLSEFSKDIYSKSGLSFICKDCSNIKTKRYKRTENGVISVMYSNQKANAKKRGRKLPNYSKEQLTEWLYLNGFKRLFDNWVSSGYKKDLIPSCDRLNDYLEYELNNLQLITWNENNVKHYEDVCCGKNTKQSTPIVSVNLLTSTRMNHYSITNASKELNINRSSIHKGIKENKQIKNYKFYIL